MGPTPGDKTYELPALASSFALSNARVDVEYSSSGELALAIDAEKGVVNVYDASDGQTRCSIATKSAAAAA